EPQIADINDEHAEHWATAPIPGVDGMAPAFAGGSDLAVWGTTEHPEAAFDYVTTLNNKENAMSYSDVSSMFPTYEDLLESDTFQEDPVLAGAAEQATGDLRQLPDTPNWGHVQWELATVQNAVERMAGGSLPEDVLPELNEELTEALNRHSDELSSECALSTRITGRPPPFGGRPRTTTRTPHDTNIGTLEGFRSTPETPVDPLQTDSAHTSQA